MIAFVSVSFSLHHFALNNLYRTFIIRDFLHICDTPDSYFREAVKILMQNQTLICRKISVALKKKKKIQNIKLELFVHLYLYNFLKSISAIFICFDLTIREKAKEIKLEF